MLSTDKISRMMAGIKMPKSECPKTLWVNMTPEVADAILEDHWARIETGLFNNRTVSINYVNSYARDIKNKNWCKNHQGAAFDEDGNLIDGQHRIMGIAKAKAPAPICITIGLPRQQKGGTGKVLNTIEHIDMGKVRGTAQQLKISIGLVNAHLKVAIARAIAVLKTEKRELKLTTNEINRILDFYNHNIETIITLTKAIKKRKYLIAAPCVVYHYINPSKCESFLESLATLEGLKANSPVLVMHKLLGSWTYKGGGSKLSGMMAACNVLMKYNNDEKQTKATVTRNGISWLWKNHKESDKLFSTISNGDK